MLTAMITAKPFPLTVPQRAIFVEREGWVYYVSNWQQRFTESVRAILVKLSPRHVARYYELKDKGRSHKTIAIILFKRQVLQRASLPGGAQSIKLISETPYRSPAAIPATMNAVPQTEDKAQEEPTAASNKIPPSGIELVPITASYKVASEHAVPIDVNILTSEQLIGQIQLRLASRLPGLRQLPHEELKRLFLALLKKSETNNVVARDIL
jgi:hypothetical protein